ncbi:MAG TPA: thioredoxin domain-containing protein [Burkholderiales bacterium]|nr:thioredoxin domain-containing protein [Burkholderiales bacterium]
MKTKTLVTLYAVGGFAAALIAAAAYFARTVEQAAARTADAGALVRFHSPSLGDAGAKVHIVEFLDPACETCRAFYPYVKEFLHANPGRVRISIRYAPFHPGSEDVVRMLEAAKRQGKYWEALEALLAAQPQWVIRHQANLDLAWQSIRHLGLNAEQLNRDMQSPEITRVIQQDIQDAVSLNVTQTPEFFVNGRPMPSFGYEQLRALVERALREQYG